MSMECNYMCLDQMCKAFVLETCRLNDLYFDRVNMFAWRMLHVFIAGLYLNCSSRRGARLLLVVSGRDRRSLVSRDCSTHEAS